MIDFAHQVQPIFVKHCYACPSPDEAEGGLQFTSKEAALSELDSGFHTIVASKSIKGEFFERLYYAGRVREDAGRGRSAASGRGRDHSHMD